MVSSGLISPCRLGCQVDEKSGEMVALQPVKGAPWIYHGDGSFHPTEIVVASLEKLTKLPWSSTFAREE